MKKQDLELGNILVFRNGDLRIFTEEESYGFVLNRRRLAVWTDDLKNTGRFGADWDVVAVYYTIQDFADGAPYWERPEEETFTLDGIEYSESTLRSLIKKATS